MQTRAACRVTRLASLEQGGLTSIGLAAELHRALNRVWVFEMQQADMGSFL